MKVSVLINNYNYSAYLEECILSVINQSYQDVEIIFYDDGSSDNSLEIAKKYTNKITIIANENYKKYPSFNQGNAIYQALLKSSGEIICLLDSDDVFVPTKIEQIVNEFKQNENLVLVQHRMAEIDKNSILNGRTKKKGLIIYNGPDLLNFTYKVKNTTMFFMQTSALSFRREYLLKVLPIDETICQNIWPDVRLSFEAIFHGELKTLTNNLTLYRVHNANDSKKLENSDFFKNTMLQYKQFSDLLTSKYGKPEITLDISKTNKIKIILLVLFSKIAFKNKINFLRSFIK